MGRVSDSSREDIYCDPLSVFTADNIRIGVSPQRENMMIFQQLEREIMDSVDWVPSWLQTIYFLHEIEQLSKTQLAKIPSDSLQNLP